LRRVSASGGRLAGALARAQLALCGRLRLRSAPPPAGPSPCPCDERCAARSASAASSWLDPVKRHGFVSTRLQQTRREMERGAQTFGRQYHSGHLRPNVVLLLLFHVCLRPVTAPLRFSAPEIRAPGRRPGRSRWRARGDRSRARARVRTARARAARARAARARTGPRRAARARVARARASATPSRATRWPARGFFTAELAALASAGAGRIPAAPSRTCSRWARA